MKKLFLALLVLLLIIGLVAWYFVSFRLDGVIEKQIEVAGSDALGTSVQVGSVTTDLKNGSLSISEIVVANPPGFNNPNAFTLNGIEAAVDYQSLDIKRVVIDNPEIVIEERSGQTNFDAMLKALDSQPAGEPAADDGKQPPQLVVHHFRMNKSRAAFESEAMDRYTDLEIDSIEVRDVRGTPQEVASVIAHAVLEEVVEEAAKEMLKAKAKEKIDGIFNRD